MRKLLLLLGVGCVCTVFGAPRTLAERFAAPEPFLIAHRGYTPEAPENSIPAFTRAAELGYAAIETDVRLTRDGKLICSHDASLKRMFGVEVVVEQSDYAELRQRVMTKGKLVGTYPADQLRLPTFDEYLDICIKYDCVPFVETKGPVAVVKPVLEVLERRGLIDIAVFSAIPIAHIRAARKLNQRIFVHHIFSKPELLDEVAAMGNAGLSWNYPDPTAAPLELLERTRAKGVKYCLRAADQPETFAKQKALGCAYFPTNVTTPKSLEQ